MKKLQPKAGEMCHYCPFSPNSEYYQVGEKWKIYWKSEGIPTEAHGCSGRSNIYEQPNLQKQCVGMQQYLSLIKRDSK